ncbi:MAG: 16S rRNA (cytidine(1402)-2'-O)-methyltransferase [Solirubrobacteraceae bacterium]|nr:16S rRNA (cytidine(1402)-2'-O)-methyltransferase [Solirubrobacteraceae bacterium]
MSVGRLVVCPTPIGNLEDVTLRVLRALREADVVACEDTRRTKVLLDRYEIATPRVRCDEHAERRATPALVARMLAGETVALVSDAGTPLVSDPGAALVRAAIDAGIAVEALPGPSAALVALVASGLASDSWRFVGFLPRRGGELEAVLRDPGALVAFDSPRRVAGTLAVLARLDPERPTALCRELTKLHEEIVRGSAAELAERFAGTEPRGEVALVIGAAQAPAGDARTGPDAASVEAVRRLVASGARPREAARVVAGLTGAAANALYRAALDEGAS